MNESKLRDIGISIGMPVYNGDVFLRRRLDMILEQTFTNFELIISDNASTDSTQSICKEYLKKDSRIHYFRQEKNIGVTHNFDFVLQQAKYEYFIWVSVDDFMSSDFIEKNIIALESNHNYVGSISKIGTYFPHEKSFKSNPIDSSYRSLLKKLRKTFKSFGVHPIVGPYDKKVKFYLNKSTCEIIYGVFRTDVLKKSSVDIPFIGNDWAIILNILRYGDFNVIDETLWNKFDGGITGGGILNSARHYNHDFLGIVFPWYPLTRWCKMNLGSKIFWGNIDFFIKLNLEGIVSISIDLTRLLAHRILKY